MFCLCCVSCCCCCTGCATNTWSVPHDLDSKISLLLLANSVSLGSMHLCVSVQNKCLKNCCVERMGHCDLLWHTPWQASWCTLSYIWIYTVRMQWCTLFHLSLSYQLHYCKLSWPNQLCLSDKSISTRKYCLKTHFDIHFNHTKTIHREWAKASILEKEVWIEY